MPQTPEIGQTVLVRGRPFVVEQIEISSLPQGIGATAQSQSLIRLSSLEDDNLGESLDVVWDLEVGAEIREASSLPHIDGFDHPSKLDAFLHAVRWGVISQTDQRTLQAPFRSGVEPEEYQLEPVARALTMPRVNLLLADDVGLGKTIEAGLVTQELILRHKVRSVLIVCPAGLQIQWQEEMRDKFGLEFRIVDSANLSLLRRQRGIHVNPWTHFPRLITSIDFFKRDRVLQRFRETLPAEGHPTYPRRYDLLILDEAHNVAPAGKQHYAVESQRTRLIRQIAPHFEHKLFLTATPHNGYRESFSALLELLDNQRFIRGVPPAPASLARAMIRRMKEEILAWDGKPRFPKRKVHYVEVEYTKEERTAHSLLRRYAALAEGKLTSGQENASSRQAFQFVLKLLKKRLFSSPAAFRDTLTQHIETRNSKAPRKAVSQIKLILPDLDDEVADISDEEIAEALSLASEVMGASSSEEQQILDTLLKWAKDAAYRADSKADALLSWLKSLVKPAGKWADQRVIIFTEYRATQNWLADLLASAQLAGDSPQGQRLMLLYGGMPSEDRERIKAAFQAAPNISGVRILLATDTASEGINLQNHCSKLIHYEIPWNPSRMEQRNGRIDRHGQRAESVDIYHFVGKGFDAKNISQKPMGDDLEGDLEFLMRAVLKVETIRQDLGKVGPVIASQVEQAMLGRSRVLDVSRAERDAQSARTMLKVDRDLRKMVQDLRQQLEETRQSLLLSSANIHHAVTVALMLAKQPALVPAHVKGLPDGSAFMLPPLAGPWARCAEGMEHPHTRKPRPLVFDAALAAGRDDVVLAHLGHRLVSMSLRLLRAQIWSAEADRKLYRASTRLVPSSYLSDPVVVAHGRIVVLGQTNRRIFEELILAGGRVKEGRFARLPVQEMEKLWQIAMQEPATPASSAEAKLIGLWPAVRNPLLNALEARKDDRLKTLEKRLSRQAEDEVARFTAVMNELEQTIRKELGTTSYQLSLFSDEEREQYDTDRTMLQHRLGQIPGERDAEIEQLLARYASPRANLFPVAVTWLMPAHLAGGRV